MSSTPRFVSIDRDYGSIVVDRLMLCAVLHTYYGSMAPHKAAIHAEYLNAGKQRPSNPTLRKLALQRRWAW